MNFYSLRQRAKAHRAMKDVNTQDFCELEEIIRKGEKAKVVYDYRFGTNNPESELN